MLQVEGRNPVKEALKITKPERILVARGTEKHPKIQEIILIAGKRDIPTEIVPKRRLDTLTQTGRHQGIITLIQLPPVRSLKDILMSNQGDVTILLLDRVQDPMNLGSILRTAEATGVDTVIIPKKESVGLTPAVLRASMGGALHVPLIRDSLYRAAKLLRQEGVTLIGIDPTATTRYYDTRLTGSVAIILGGEDQGLNSTLQNQCHSLARIPMYGAITTLNVSAATAVTLYERTRQQTNNKNRRITP